MRNLESVALKHLEFVQFYIGVNENLSVEP